MDRTQVSRSYTHPLSHFAAICSENSVEGDIGCFQVLSIMNKAAINIVEQVFLWYGRASFEYIPRVIHLDLEIENASYDSICRNYSVVKINLKIWKPTEDKRYHQPYPDVNTAIYNNDQPDKMYPLV
ncbi:hypothetical protein STEG23_021182 [Scotinomys teguina]